jgi:4-hydroxybenzoate polyprenyltransferase
MSSMPESLILGEHDTIPLVVDLDGTLIRSDLFVESTFAYLAGNPRRIGGLLLSLLKGKAALKAKIARGTAIDAAHLPYDERVLGLVRAAREEGRPVYLASASNQRYVLAVFEHLRLFDGWFASDERENLSAGAKARRLVEAFGARAFDYVGNERADLAVWMVARRRIAIDPTAAVRRNLLKLDPEALLLNAPDRRFYAWLKLLRVHQWSKNALVLVPLLTSQHFDLVSIYKEIGAFFAFSLAASSVYILNDLVDLDADRKHSSKKERPLAAGTVPILDAAAVTPILMMVALLGALSIAPLFGAVLATYLVLTTAYTFVLKRKMLVDVIVLAALYTIRVIGGAAAISVPVSEWLLAFSMFIFTSIALIKRYAELAARLDADMPDLTTRNYRNSDLNIVAALAAASGFNAVTVFALYISSDTVRHLYRHPQLLWLVCPILMYWVGRALLMAHRRLMNDDPILFVLRDWNSLIAIGLIGAILIAAM